MSKKIQERVERIVISMLEQDYELVDVEFIKEAGQFFLRIYIDKEGGFTLEDCRIYSKKISDALDSADLIQQSYFLEVSSPGLERKLKKTRDFVRETGKEVVVKLFEAINGKKELEGTLIGLDGDDKITIKMENETIIIDRKNIALCKLFVRF